MKRLFMSFKEWLRQTEMAGTGAIVPPGTKANAPGRDWNVWGAPETQGKSIRQAQKFMDKGTKKEKRKK